MIKKKIKCTLFYVLFGIEVWFHVLHIIKRYCDKILGLAISQGVVLE